jgi:hypothetical protein
VRQHQSDLAASFVRERAEDPVDLVGRRRMRPALGSLEVLRGLHDY